MGGIYLIAPTLIAIFISFLVVRGAAVLLMLTGMDERRARFQAISAFTGTGFTTREAELVVNHPQRRRIVTWLMVFGYAGVVTFIVTVTSSLITSRGYYETGLILLVVPLYAYVIYRLAKLKGFTSRWEGFIAARARKSYPVEEGSTEELLHLLEGYGLVRVLVKTDWPLADRCVSQQTCAGQGLVVVGIERGNEWIPAPKAEETLNEGDRIVVYGPLKVLRSSFRK